MSKRPNKSLSAQDRRAIVAPVEVAAPSKRSAVPIPQTDIAACVLIAAAIVAAPLVAGSFAAPPPGGPPEAEFLFGSLGTIGFSIVLILTAVGAVLADWHVWKPGSADREERSALNRPARVGAAAIVGATVLGVLSVLVAAVRAAALTEAAMLLAAVLAGRTAARLGRRPELRLALVSSIAGAGALVSVYGVREFLLKVKDGDSLHRVFSTFSNPDFLAGYLLIPILVTFALCIALRESRGRALAYFALAFQTACLMYTGSRAGIGISLIPILLLIACAVRVRGSRAIGKLIAIACCVMLVTAFFTSDQIKVRVIDRIAIPRSGKSGGQQDIAAAQGHSREFRIWTWRGTVRMAVSNPVLGTGIGSFETAYAHYAFTAYTGHAHNGLLQWAGETGILSGLLLPAGVVLIVCGALFALWRRSGPRAAPEDAPLDLMLLQAGLAAAIAGSFMHNLVDSDWYIVGSALTLAVVIGLAYSGLPQTAEDAARAKRQRIMARFAVIAVAFILWRAVAVGMERTDFTAALSATSGDEAASEANAAISADPLDPEPRLLLASLEDRAGNQAAAISSLRDAVHVAPSGRTYYRLGQALLRAGDTTGGINALKEADRLEPTNVQTLHALAKALQDHGDVNGARAIYLRMTALEAAPYGQVRAVPEIVETEFAYAHMALGDMAAAGNDWADASREYGRAVFNLTDYWKKRGLDMNMNRPLEKRTALAALYQEALVKWGMSMQNNNKPGEASVAAAILTQVKADIAADELAAEQAKQHAADSP